MFLKKEKKGICVSWVSSMDPDQAAPYCLWRISISGACTECSPGSTVSMSGGRWQLECGQGDLKKKKRTRQVKTVLQPCPQGPCCLWSGRQWPSCARGGAHGWRISS